MRTLLFVLIACSASPAQNSLPPAANVKLDLVRDIQPLLAQKCLSCHGDEVRQSGLHFN